jgi:hypothetical protein
LLDNLFITRTQFGIPTGLFLNDGTDPVVLPGVWRHVAEDAQLVDVWIVFWVDSLELGVQGGVAGAGQASIALIDLGVRVTLLEVDEMVFTGDPGRHGVLDLVHLGSEALMLNETTQRFGVAGQAILSCRRDEHTSAKVALVVLTAEGVNLAGALQVDILALGVIRIESAEDALHDEAGQADEFGEGPYFLLGRMPERILFFG